MRVRALVRGPRIAESNSIAGKIHCSEDSAKILRLQMERSSKPALFTIKVCGCVRESAGKTPRHVESTTRPRLLLSLLVNPGALLWFNMVHVKSLCIPHSTSTLPILHLNPAHCKDIVTGLVTGFYFRSQLTLVCILVSSLFRGKKPCREAADSGTVAQG